MRIVVLDGHTLNPGDLTWAELEALGKCVIHKRTPPEETIARAAGAAIVLTNKVVITADTIRALPDLRYVGVLATGYNVVDIAAARARGIPVTNVPGYGTRSVAQFVFALLLELCHRTGHHADSVRQGAWSRSPDFCYWHYPLIELAEKTMGLVGFGRIGQAVAELARAFGLNVLVHTRTIPAAGAFPGVRFTDLDTVFRESDIVSLHCPLTSETKQFVNAARLAQMKPTAFLLNTSRGPLVDDAALSAALEAGRLAGAGLDVLTVEPPPADHPLFTARNCLITPHIAWATQAARARLMKIVVENVRAFLAGKPQNVVN